MSIKFLSTGKREANQASISSRIVPSAETSRAFRAHELLIKQIEARRGKI